ncbi:hypothetical protein RSP816_15225 (plasmid) [Ralstonia solanacearum]|nr:hypothetical protein RSP597_19625 [Ralstonia solanacearum]RCW08260.1 hypothetical protein RSP816_15225 [Ralstonia solanacearum]
MGVFDCMVMLLWCVYFCFFFVGQDMASEAAMDRLTHIGKSSVASIAANRCAFGAPVPGPTVMRAGGSV